MISTKQISEHKWGRVWASTGPTHRSYTFNPDKMTYTIICIGDGFRYQRVWNIDETKPDKMYQHKRIDYTSCQHLFDLLWRRT
jgi:hypothetical protein